MELVDAYAQAVAIRTLQQHAATTTNDAILILPPPERQAVAKAISSEFAASDNLAITARGVVERWDTPLWKDVPATAVYVNALRNALVDYTS